MPNNTIINMTFEEWMAEGTRRFGADQMLWKFKCPSCGHVASVADWKKVGASEGEVAFSCIGRHLDGAKTIFQKPGPCNYTGGGLFRLNPVHISKDGKTHQYFEFAEA